MVGEGEGKVAVKPTPQKRTVPDVTASGIRVKYVANLFHMHPRGIVSLIREAEKKTGKKLLFKRDATFITWEGVDILIEIMERFIKLIDLAIKFDYVINMPAEEEETQENTAQPMLGETQAGEGEGQEDMEESEAEEEQPSELAPIPY